MGWIVPARHRRLAQSGCDMVPSPCARHLLDFPVQDGEPRFDDVPDELVIDLYVPMNQDVPERHDVLIVGDSPRRIGTDLGPARNRFADDLELVLPLERQ